MVVNSCFEGMEGIMGLRRVWEFIPKAGKKRNERVKVSRATSSVNVWLPMRVVNRSSALGKG